MHRFTCVIILSTLFFNTANAQVKKPVMFLENPQHTAVYNTTPVYKLQEIRFRFKINDPIRGTPAIDGKNLYFGGGDGYFYAIDAQSGKEKWKFKTGGAIYSSAAVMNSIAYFASRDGFLYGLNTDNGKLLWKFKMEADLGKENYWDNYLSSPVIVNNNLFIGSGDGYLYAFDLNTKKMLWKYNSGARIRTTAAVFENNLVFGNNAGYVFNINPATGKEKWKFATDGVGFTYESGDNDRKSIYCSPSISEGVVITGGRDGIIYAIDMATGKEKWRNDHKGPWILSAAIKDGVAFVGCGSDFLLQALDLKTGIEKWKFKAPGGIFSSITIAGDILYFNDVDVRGNLHALDIKTGLEKWKFPTGCRSFSTPAINNGIIYNAAENGTIYGLQGSSVADAPTPAPRKIIYWQGKKDPKDFTVFLNGIDEFFKSYFTATGYQLADAKKLEEVMKEQLTLKTKSVIVFADNKFPDNITDERSGKPLIRKYLDAGGKVALFNLNPMAYIKDTSGRITAIDDSIASAVFDIKYVEKKFVRGLYEFTPTAEGRKYGLYSSVSGVSGPTVITPDRFTKSLVTDEFGSTTMWLKNYGGPEGSGLLQLWLPPFEVSPNLAEIRTVIEYGISW